MLLLLLLVLRVVSSRCHTTQNNIHKFLYKMTAGKKDSAVDSTGKEGIDDHAKENMHRYVLPRIACRGLLDRLMPVLYDVCTSMDGDALNELGLRGHQRAFDWASEAWDLSGNYYRDLFRRTISRCIVNPGIFVRLREVDFGTECSEMDDDALIEHGLSGRRRAMEWSLEIWGDRMDIDEEGNGLMRIN